MKRLFKNIICAVLAPVALVSCMDLDENVYDKLPTDEFGTTEKQINAIMAPAYQSLKNMLAYDGPWGAADMTADILIAPTREVATGGTADNTWNNVCTVGNRTLTP